MYFSPNVGINSVVFSLYVLLRLDGWKLEKYVRIWVGVIYLYFCKTYYSMLQCLTRNLFRPHFNLHEMIAYDPCQVSPCPTIFLQSFKSSPSSLFAKMIIMQIFLPLIIPQKFLSFKNAGHQWLWTHFSEWQFAIFCFS